VATHPFRIVNVFTENQGPLTGNPLCVVENGASLSTELMQALARQFNLSETTFILPATGAANARVRIFTPDYEMPFAGHPTLGTAQVCRDLNLGADSLVLETKAGLIPVRARANCWTLTAPAATWREADVSRAVLATALGLKEADIGDRPVWAKAGTEQLVVPLASSEAVRRAAPVARELLKIRSEEGQSMAYVFAMNGADQALARFFFSQGSAILEDPATGSATANFGAWWLCMQRTLPVRLKISQGEFVRRPSTLFLEVDDSRQICVGGEVIEIGRGTLNL
jgi:trans-2,3-dihydro-3-hydroxyanthranilate isomerase